MHTMIDDDPEKLSGFHSGIASDKWKIWKTGICFVHGNQILFVLKQESNLKVNPSSIQVNIFEEKFRIELHLYLNQLFTLTQDKEHPLSQSYITGLATNLLVMISQHVELLVQSWFPCMLKTKSNSSTITHVPCWKCYAGIGFDDLSSVCHHIPGCFLFTSRNPVFCFVLEEDIILSALGKNLHCPIHNELEFLHMMPDHVRNAYTSALQINYYATLLQLFVDVNAVFEDSRYTLFDDSNRILGKGGFGFVFEGELRSKVRLYFVYLIASYYKCHFICSMMVQARKLQ